jgi:hypothetical protein
MGQKTPKVHNVGVNRPALTPTQLAKRRLHHDEEVMAADCSQHASHQRDDRCATRA